MGRIERFVVALIALAAADPGAAFADTRIFSVKTTAPGIAVEKAFQNGAELPLVGHGDGSTLFRIDNTADAVPCTNHVVFVTSDQQKIDFAADFCVLNWVLTLDVKTAATPPSTAAPVVAAPAATAAAAPPPAVAPAAPPPPVAPAAPPAVVAAPASSPVTVQKQTVTIKTDDPIVTVKEVTLDRQPVKISGMDKNAVKIEVAGGPQGVKCQRYLGVVLSDGRSIARPTNICANNGNVVVALTASSGPAAPVSPGAPARVITPGRSANVAGAKPAVPGASAAAAPPEAGPAGPTAPGAAPPPTAMLPAPGAPTTTPPPEGDMVWDLVDQDARIVLVYGVKDGEMTELEAACQKGTSQVTVSLSPVGPSLKPGARISVRFSAGAFAKTYPGVGSPISDETGQSQPQVAIGANDALWQAIISEQQLSAAALPNPPVIISLKGSAAMTRRFLGLCGAPVVAAAPAGAAGQPPPPPSGPPGRLFTVNYSCGDGSAFAITFDVAHTTAQVAEPGAAPVTLYRTAARPGDHFVAGPSQLVGEGEVIRWSRGGEQARICRPVLR